MSIRFTHERASFFFRNTAIEYWQHLPAATSNSHQDSASQIIYMRNRTGHIQKVLDHATLPATALKPGRILVTGKVLELDCWKEK
jgi:hypothetical protein